MSFSYHRVVLINVISRKNTPLRSAAKVFGNLVKLSEIRQTSQLIAATIIYSDFVSYL